jgi:hypothetical protein
MRGQPFMGVLRDVVMILSGSVAGSTWIVASERYFR